MPGTSVFAAWLRAVERHDAPPTGFCNTADVAVLDALYKTAGGTGWTESGGWPDGRFVEDWYGVDVDSVGRVTELDLTHNGLEGELPPDLGAMTRLTVLRIGNNGLSGRLPLSLARAPLREFHYAETELCSPADESFQTWLAAIALHEGTGVECIPLTEREILGILYNATGGWNWRNNSNWLTDAPLRDWYGISVDGQDRVVRLFLQENNLAGPIPPELGNLATLTGLDLSGNDLSDALPPELGNLASLTALSLSSNRFSGPIPPELGNLALLMQLNLGANEFTSSIPAELGNLATLKGLALYGNDLSGPIPPELGNLVNLIRLSLSGNNLTDAIPAELGNLATLETLYLHLNDLSGPLPPELGNLTNLRDLRVFRTGVSGAIPPEFGNLIELRELHLSNTALTGAIPPEFGRLVNLRYLSLWGNGHTGPIPPELGKLTALEELRLYNTNLSGPIPSELGGLAALEELHLYNANLSGPLPPELGNLANVRFLSLASNALSGPVPPEFGALTNVQALALANNAGLVGALPQSLTELDRLEELVTSGTDLCAPADAGFRAWLDGVHKRRIRFCIEADPPIAYLTQAVQSRAFPVPLVAGETALLRVFPTAMQATGVGIPAVRARFYVNGRETHAVDIPGKSTPIPVAVDESSLAKSANAEIPAEIIRQGLEMVIEVDPAGTLDEALGVAKRIPVTGRLAVDVRAMPPFDLTLIPFVWIQTQDSAIVDLVGAMAADPEKHEMLGDTRTLMPVGSLSVTAHEPVLTSSNNGFQVFGETRAIQAMEGGTGHYMGMMANPVTGTAGIARVSGRWSFSIPEPSTIAHELGHNMSLRHAPCGGPGGLDASYPYPDGSIGVWGYDFRDGGNLVQPSRPDVMSYCFPGQWISDYGFTNALRYRLFDEGAPAPAAVSARARSLLLWGGVDAEGEPSLNPAFVVDAPAALPDSAGEYEIAGRGADGRQLFSLAFTMPETADGDGSSSFTFVLPVRGRWEDDLDRIVLTGPGGSFTLDGDTDRPMAILRDPRTGQVRGILRDLPPPTQAAMDATGHAAGTGLEVIFSRGIPDAAAWRR
ncbi:MAG: hypothetical protein F4Y73_05410 [Gemmatimonadetes bacterium]|nr:hypothetical protein [Gemmatimonadota bacterium]